MIYDILTLSSNHYKPVTAEGAAWIANFVPGDERIGNLAYPTDGEQFERAAREDGIAVSPLNTWEPGQPMTEWCLAHLLPNRDQGAAGAACPRCVEIEDRLIEMDVYTR